MKIEEIWEHIFSYDDYTKGGEYSASDIIGDILSVKLNRLYPNKRKMD